MTDQEPITITITIPVCGRCGVVSTKCECGRPKLK